MRPLGPPWVPGLVGPDKQRRAGPPPRARAARRQLAYELVSSASGAALALFMWGHMLFVASIWFGARGFDWLAAGLEKLFVAQPTVVAISALFLVHAALASRKIPAQLRERRRMRAVAAGLATGERGGVLDLAPGDRVAMAESIESYNARVADDQRRAGALPTIEPIGARLRPGAWRAYAAAPEAPQRSE